MEEYINNDDDDGAWVRSSIVECVWNGKKPLIINLRSPSRAGIETNKKKKMNKNDARMQRELDNFWCVRMQWTIKRKRVSAQTWAYLEISSINYVGGKSINKHSLDLVTSTQAVELISESLKPFLFSVITKLAFSVAGVSPLPSSHYSSSPLLTAK